MKNCILTTLTTLLLVTSANAGPCDEEAAKAKQIFTRAQAQFNENVAKANKMKTLKVRQSYKLVEAGNDELKLWNVSFDSDIPFQEKNRMIDEMKGNEETGELVKEAGRISDGYDTAMMNKAINKYCRLVLLPKLKADYQDFVNKANSALKINLTTELTDE